MYIYLSDNVVLLFYALICLFVTNSFIVNTNETHNLA